MTVRGWAYTGIAVGGVLSVVANIAHSLVPPRGAPAGWNPEPGAIVGATVWPFLLFVAIEIFARTAWPSRKGWQVLRWAGPTPVALVAAFVSYRHMSGLLAHYGEEHVITLAGPIAVDGLMAMATGALIATGVRKVPTVVAISQVSTSDSPQQTATSVDSIPSDLLPPLPAHLRDAARAAAMRHRERTGRDITAAELRDALHISHATAAEVLAAVAAQLNRSNGSALSTREGAQHAP